MKVKSLCKFLLLITVLLFTMGCSGNTIGKKLIRVSNGQPASHPDNIAMEAFKKYIEDKLGDKYEVKIYPNGLLGASKNALELCQTGALEFVIASASNMETFDDIYSIFSIPYIFDNVTAYYEVMNNETRMSEIYNTTIDQGVLTVGWFDAGTRNFYTNKPIRTVEDVKGMKIRVQPSPTNIAMMDAFGAGAVPMPFSEVYTAIQNNTVDGAENNEMALTSVKHGEVVKYYNYNMHQMVPDFLVANYLFINGLDDSEKAIFREAIKIAEKVEQEEWKKQTQEAIEVSQSKMGVEFIESDVQSFKERVIPLHQQILKNNSKIKALYDYIDEMNKKYKDEV
ncbi:TRAP transporter substrate-binding protein [Treponema phagedenis]|uniref:TRAP transporter solute receptor, DctP family n=1 Tax=Treponema phagedenis TaxID=162 RepID=A0A0B7H2K0_TREPH|nr:TRAP transporter substrate-binding protein [Treponema phagedenis]EFW38879.1 TRAP transporter solute receptor, DctP family [Treponema phagedenis F0421]NVP23912.1 TRAP transporter substrate-binding protein [Treponema phagedenis]QEJ93825.1 TRAP transporter substrate-binding protein [Treponema phagedenis]QEJ96583.1 TRAP transporter substrate-binding protein [Treponema phagedenis]QEJ99750.1 TRAP transporter substrate-binding protein [Treponema phagedenis]